MIFYGFNFSPAFCVPISESKQILDKHVKIHTGKRPFRWFVKKLLNINKLWQVWPMWWRFHPGWRSKETHPETQDQRGHAHRGGKGTTWNGQKTMRALWSKIRRWRCLEKAPEIPYGYQGLCVYWVRKRILREKSQRQPLQHCALGVKNFPCEQCGKMFGRSSALHVHMTKIHPHAIVKEGERKLEIPATYPALSMIPAPAADSDREPHPHPP